MNSALMHLPMAIAASLLLALPSSAGAGQPAAGSDPCAGFKWDVTRERALFSGPAAPLDAATRGSAPALAMPGRLYRLQLAPTAKIVFPAAPGRPAPANTYAGVLRLAVPGPGFYRIAVDAPLWIDLLADGQLLPPTDYEGQRDCSGPRKIVEFDLEGAHRWTLQLSAAAQANVRLAIVAASVPP
ncbi:MAG TPA: hypothetical protein VHY75_12900 [Steroidobacteraceae bacterium]|jgi:hypothetical protein|nr:hypothetical protein [Steroidobacteraceae bacterium]